MMKRILSVLLLLGSARAFAPPPSTLLLPSKSSSCSSFVANINNAPRLMPSTSSNSATALSEKKRQWNFNSGRSPWGLKKNAEIWNGRVAQMAFVIVLLQELLTGKGVIASFQDGDAVGYAFLGFAGVTTLGLTAWLAIKGDESDVVF